MKTQLLLNVAQSRSKSFYSEIWQSTQEETPSLFENKGNFTGGGQKLRTDSLVLPVADNIFK